MTLQCKSRFRKSVNPETVKNALRKHKYHSRVPQRKPYMSKKKANGQASQMNSLAASVKLTYSASMVDRLTDFCLKVRHEIGVSSIKVMNPPIDTRSSLFVAKIRV
ncbi:hypothetical protein TNCV_1283331 [Trichonephila clavipes]|uniref:Uncharacterized protein n=1 Tax=Trichonephila clavipes TaxID=2585209 RepID=A0A8X6SQC0_TRICX|nr:hypothetical protein TNCV_1283331 [Trichonephila clavipes]